MSRLRYQGYLRSIWNYFTKVRPAKKRVRDEVVGTDLSGNQYILRHGDSKAGLKESRIVLPSDETMESYAENMGIDVPVEWNEWLRYRRDEPPTIDELQMNQLKKLKIQQKVRELDRKERLEKGEDLDLIDSEETKGKTLSQSFTQDISGDTTKSPFPNYDDLEKEPGELRRGPKV